MVLHGHRCLHGFAGGRLTALLVLTQLTGNLVGDQINADVEIITAFLGTDDRAIDVDRYFSNLFAWADSGILFNGKVDVYIIE